MGASWWVDGPQGWPGWALPLLASPFVGSLLGLLAMRLPQGRPVALARSECDRCHHPLGPVDLVPIASFLLLRGRCRFCRAPIGRAHLAAELAAVLIVLVAMLLRPDADPSWIWSAAVLGWSALLLGWIDLRCLRLPDAITLPLLLVGLAATALREPDVLGEHALAAACAYLGLRGIALAYRRLRGRDGLGAGDAKLLAAGGAWLGVQALPWMLFAGALLTLSLAVLLRRTRGTDAVPFGPGLAVALWGVFLSGQS